ncbi:hypothetical protein ABEB36_000855 [Hypothenemus hampei]|uniref:Uncharacterized protein n=1 Tax=Hypothenemus hampei TaxID=57062 RepID=A0ABD1FG88_HYPHA
MKSTRSGFLKTVRVHDDNILSLINSDESTCIKLERRSLFIRSTTNFQRVERISQGERLITDLPSSGLFSHTPGGSGLVAADPSSPVGYRSDRSGLQRSARAGAALRGADLALSLSYQANFRSTSYDIFL